MNNSIPPAAHAPYSTERELDLVIADLKEQHNSLQNVLQDQNKTCEQYKKDIAILKQNLTKIQAGLTAILHPN